MPEKKTDLKSTRGGKFVPPGGGHSKYTYDINPYSRPAIPDKAPVYVWEASL